MPPLGVAAATPIPTANTADRNVLAVVVAITPMARRRPLATVVIGEILSSTALTLVVLPVLYSVFRRA